MVCYEHFAIEYYSTDMRKFAINTEIYNTIVSKDIGKQIRCKTILF